MNSMARNYTGSPWSDDRLERARTLWLKGDSALTIARAIAEIGWKPSRNAVIGVARRHGWSKDGRMKPCAPKVPSSAFRPAMVARPVRVLSAPVVADAPPPVIKAGPVCEPVSLMNLTRSNCRYPVAGEGADTLFCGATTSETYCPAHRKLCWVGLPDRKKSRKYDPDVMAARRAAWGH